MTDRELFKMALDMILAAIKSGDWKVDGACDPDIVIEALRARLAEDEIHDGYYRVDAWIKEKP